MVLCLYDCIILIMKVLVRTKLDRAFNTRQFCIKLSVDTLKAEKLIKIKLWLATTIKAIMAVFAIDPFIVRDNGRVSGKFFDNFHSDLSQD